MMWKRQGGGPISDSLILKPNDKAKSLIFVKILKSRQSDTKTSRVMESLLLEFDCLIKLVHVSRVEVYAASKLTSRGIYARPKIVSRELRIQIWFTYSLCRQIFDLSSFPYFSFKPFIPSSQLSGPFAGILGQKIQVSVQLVLCYRTPVVCI